MFSCDFNKDLRIQYNAIIFLYLQAYVGRCMHALTYDQKPTRLCIKPFLIYFRWRYATK